MGAQAVDYRVSKVIVCCKDCGQDVGLYPARHKCQDVVRPPLPPLPTKFDDSPNLRVPRKPIPSYDSNNNNNNNNNNEINRSRPTSAASSNSSGTTHHNVTSDTSSATSTGSKWSRFVRSPSNNNMKTATTTTTNNNNHGGENDDDSFYYNNFAAHLPDQTTDSGGSPGQAGKKLWGKVRQNEKWKQLNEKYDKPKQSAKLWGKLVQATQTISEKIPSRDDRGPESDESDWEGETHVSRVLREYYEKKHEPLPRWLFDERAPQPKMNRFSNHRPTHEQDDSMLPPLDRQGLASRPSKKKLWEADPEPQMSQREREREELRQQKQRRAPPPLADTSHNAYEHSSSEERSYRQQQKSRSGASHLDPYEDRAYSTRRAPVIEPSSHRSTERSYTTNNSHSQSRRTAPSMDHDMYEDRHGTSRSATYHRPVENDEGGGGWKMSSRNKAPSRYGDDDNNSRSYLSDRHVPATARARSPSRYNDDISSSTSSDNYGNSHRYSERDRVRGPRDIPQQFSNRYSERGGGYF